MKRTTYILSTCGTSILSNIARSINTGKINYGELARIHANIKNEKDIATEDLANLRYLITAAQSKMKTADVEQAKEQSAELNSILSYFEVSKPKADDIFELLATDTWLGKQTANIIKDWLETNFDKCQVLVSTINGLQTERYDDFQQALLELLKKLDEEKRKEYCHVVFNLTGGFKGVVGFLQSVANSYADETIYIFETSTLLRIPSIPVKLEFESLMKENINTFRQFMLGLSPKNHSIDDIFLLKIDSEETLNAWGEYVWNNLKLEIYKKELLPSPHPRIQYTSTFKKATEQYLKQAGRMYEINCKIDDFANYLESGKHLKSLDFKSVQGKLKISTHEIDAWSDGAARRIFLHKKGNNWFLDDLNKGLH